MLCFGSYSSPLGEIVLAGDEEALVGLWFVGQKHFGEGFLEEIAGDASGARADSCRGWEPFFAEGRRSFSAKDRRGREPEAIKLAREASKGEPEVFELARRWLDQYFGGERPSVEVPVRLEGTRFQREVWAVLATIPYGKTMTYGEVARRVEEVRGGVARDSGGRVSARAVGTSMQGGLTRGAGAGVRVSARAVGNAVGRNRISLIIPCHRVIGADGSLTGYAGGVERKRRLLEGEGIRVE